MALTDRAAKLDPCGMCCRNTTPSGRLTEVFQVWSGEEGLLDKAHHVSQKVVQPGENSDLRKITEQAWKGFKGNEINAFKIT